MNETSTHTDGVHRKRLFAGICLSLIPTGAAFGMLTNVVGQLKSEFILTNAHIGWITGSSVGFMALSLLVLGPLLESYGLKKGTILAFLGHIVGLTCIIAASAFSDPESRAIGITMLTIGSIILACGNGMIEVVGNPLTAALYPENKSAKLNLFHAFFPIAIVAGSLLGFGLNTLEGVAGGVFYHWTFQLGVVYIPMIIYGIMLLPLKFPKTENAEAGVPVGEMFRYTFTQPLMYLMLICMAIAMSIEFGVQRWVSPIFEHVIGSGSILLLSWASFIMILLRVTAGTFIYRLTPPGMLAVGGLSGFVALLIYSSATNAATAFIAATFLGIGVAFFFPTIVGIVSERMPKAGSLGIVLTCGVGLAGGGFIGQPLVGWIGDRQLADYLQEESPERTIQLLETVRETYPEYLERAQAASPEERLELGYLPANIESAIGATAAALASYEENGQQIVGNAVPQALRAIRESATPGGDAGDQAGQLLNPEEGDPAAVDTFAREHPGNAAVLAGGIIGPGEGVAGQQALLWISWLPLVLAVIFGAMFLRDRARGGYKAVRLEHADAGT